QQASIQIELRPSQTGNLALTCACQGQQPQDSDVTRVAAMLFKRGKNIAKAGKFGWRQEAIPSIVPVALHASDGALLDEAILDGEVENAAQEADRSRGCALAASRVRRRILADIAVAHVNHQPLDIGPGDIGDFHVSDTGVDMPL